MSPDPRSGLGLRPRVTVARSHFPPNHPEYPSGYAPEFGGELWTDDCQLPSTFHSYYWGSHHIKQVATNCRPISLLSTLSKCLEKLIFRRLYSHLDPFLPSHQSGFRQKDSTAYQLAHLIHRLASALDEGHTTLACFYDLSKACDRVWHCGLLAELYHFGVRGQAHVWITNYLSDRRQCVRFNGCDSSWLAVPAGVPQGSVLGPLLFLAYTIDLPNCVAVPTSCNQFADDTALTTVSPSPTECEGHLQRSVDATSTWLSEWKLAVNVDKTVSMEFTRRPFSSDFAINLNSNTLKKVRMQRHLGLVLTSDLRWTAHVNQVLSKAARLLPTGLKRLRCTLSKAALTLYYCLHIRPVVEYGCVAMAEAPCTSPRSSGALPKAGFQSHPEEAPVRTL